MRKTLILFILLCSTIAFAKEDRRNDPSYQVEHDKTKGYTPTEHYTVQEIAQLMGLSAGYIPYITSDYLFGNSTLYVSGSNLFTTSNEFTINSDLGNVTSKLIFGRTTGGNAELSWNGSLVNINKAIESEAQVIAHEDYGFRNSIYKLDAANPIWSFNNATTYGLSYYQMNTPGQPIGLSEDAIGFHFGTILSPTFYSTSSGIGYFAKKLSIGTTSFIGSEQLRVNGDVYADGAIKSASDITINSDLGDVTSKLIFGRTTGGNGEIAYGGSKFEFNKLLRIPLYLSGSNSYLIEFYSDANSFYGFGMGPTSKEGYVNYYSAYPNGGDSAVYGHRWYAGTAERMRLNSLGQVGINTTSFIGTEKLRVNGNQYNDGTASLDALILREKSSDPADPAEGQSVIWQSDGTGAGDDGDLMVKITAGGVTKTTTLVDFSGI